MHDATPRRRAVVRAEPFMPDGKLTFSKVDAVFKAGNATRDTIPSHLIVGRGRPAEVAELYTHMCPAGVYERQGDGLVVNPPNCIDCKATDVLGPALDAPRRRERAAVPADVSEPAGRLSRRPRCAASGFRARVAPVP